MLAFIKLPSHIDMMQSIGFTRDWVGEKLRLGNEFRLVIFPADAGKPLISPTWDNLCELTRRESAAAGEKLARHLPELKSTPWPGWAVIRDVGGGLANWR